MFLGAVTGTMRDHAAVLRRGAVGIDELSRSVGTAVEAVEWIGSDRERFGERAVAAVDLLVDCARQLETLAGGLAAEADQQDAASEHDAAVTGRASHGSEARDQDDPSILPDMAEPEPYDAAEGDAEENIGSRGVEQGRIGDCWFLAALMGIAERDPDYIREHLWKNGDGSWTVRMYKDGEPVEIIVDSEFSADAANHRVPVRDENGEVMLDDDGVPIMESVSGGWPAIYEKAAVEYRSRYGDPDYEHIETGWGDEGYEMLTPNGSEKTGEASFEEIQERLDRGPVSVASEHPEDAKLYPWWEGAIDDSTVVPRHEYNVAGFVPAGEEAPDGSVSTEDRIHLENPWGPDGGTYDGVERSGDLYLTETQYKDSFRNVSSVEMEG